MPTTSPGLIIAVTIIGGLLALVGALIVLYLRSIKGLIHGQEEQIRSIRGKTEGAGERLLECKVDCDRNMVSKEDWVRSEGYTRKEIKELGTTLARIEGKLAIAENMPEIIGSTVRGVVKELKEAWLIKSTS